MGELGALFNPGMRHELEERQAKAARREEEGNARDGDLRIDLESGVAVINIPGAGDEPVGIADDDSPQRGTSRGVEAAAADQSSGTAQGDGPALSNTSPQSTSPQSDTPRDQNEGAPTGAPELRPRGKRGMSASHR
jgi:hypothetical protein